MDVTEMLEPPTLEAITTLLPGWIGRVDFKPGLTMVLAAEPEDPAQPTVEVRHTPTDSTFRVAASGVISFGLTCSAYRSPWTEQKASAARHRFRTLVVSDLPIHLPVTDCTVHVPTGGAVDLAREHLRDHDDLFAKIVEELDYAEEVIVHVQRVRAGQQMYSNVLPRGPYFTRLLILHDGYVAIPAPLVAAVTNYLLSILATLREDEVRAINSIDFPAMSLYFLGSTPPLLAGIGLEALPELVEIPAEEELFDLSDDLLESLSEQRLRLQEFLQHREHPTRRTIEGEVIGILDEFTFYARQNPEVLSGMKEEHIRDLLLLVMRFRLRAEGEAFNYSGKTDIKFTSTVSALETGVLELKWWRGDDSFRDVVRQALVEHSTGQEQILFAIVLSRNTDRRAVWERILRLVDDEDAIHELEAEDTDTASTLFLRRAVAECHGETLPLNLGLMDLHFENPRVAMR